MNEEIMKYWENIFQHVTEMFPEGHWTKAISELNCFVAITLKKNWIDFDKIDTTITELAVRYKKRNNISIDELKSKL